MPNLRTERLPKLSTGWTFSKVVAGLIAIVTSAAPGSAAASEPQSIPAWLEAHVGDGDGQITSVVLQRARALYLRKVSEGAVNNPCYFAMDATRPTSVGTDQLGRRFYTICEASQTFKAVSAGFGSGRNLRGVVDFSNGRQCARNFGNAQDALLTTGGGYVTAETRTSFKGYYRSGLGKSVPFIRSFVQFDGEGDTANARVRAIGGHPAQVLKGMCRSKNSDSAYADEDGYVRMGKLVDYAGGRSNGCTSWSSSDARKIIPLMQDNPTTVYIYPERRDIEAVATAVKTGQPLARTGVYWNSACLKAIRTPKFWQASTLEPLIARYNAAHPAQPAQELPICKQS
ncbi:murein L,D-transpeptidase catalytic domain family protein [Mangrovicella endophytica]|uniref:murein L,D-transpeptidase catalytic domain family protein n=1 Tax=Mangrovicella endophytica TaxID=2066697 RepID=UPI001FDEE9AB|nr:murein L,D-transpeptidase catalytic domain family protein [Mangrovicella endophytica]